MRAITLISSACGCSCLLPGRLPCSLWECLLVEDGRWAAYVGCSCLLEWECVCGTVQRTLGGTLLGCFPLCLSIAFSALGCWAAC
jgi:hypothetical protein